ncbi:hypothetical protein Ciccas_003588 [Cichlidogyrus casuarinus]|uniref:C2H2-type domain-containing protein n=1 Tax=Cichlidogyrus casuarinus TaxID=1844966 RepID=A0ABD2QDZ9_9PLAT
MHVQKTNYYYQQYAMKNKLKEIHRQLVRQRNARMALAKTLSDKEAALKLSENGAPMTAENRAKWVKALQEADASLDSIDGGPESERPYACEVCGSRFKLKAVLMRHIRCVHSETRPYTCDYCGSSFKIRNRLTTHIKMVHPPSKRLCEALALHGKRNQTGAGDTEPICVIRFANEIGFHLPT